MGKRYLYNIYAGFCLLAIFQSCENDVHFKDKQSSPKMVVNSIINASEGQKQLKLSESVFVFGDQKPKPVENAELQLKINGIETPLTFEETKESHRYYSFRADFKSGDKVEISGKSLEHNPIYVVDYVPEPVEITGVKTEWFTGKADNKSYLRTLITLRDKPREKNFYRVVIRVKDIYEHNGKDETDWIQYDVHVDQEPLFNHIPNTPWNENPDTYRIFSDELIDGKEYTLNVYLQMDRDNPWGAVPQTFIKAEIHTLSENLYRYLRSVELARETDYFAEPVKIFSNIQGGYGIMGIYNVNEKITEVER